MRFFSLSLLFAWAPVPAVQAGIIGGASLFVTKAMQSHALEHAALTSVGAGLGIFLVLTASHRALGALRAAAARAAAEAKAETPAEPAAA